MFVESWDEFAQRARILYLSAPTRTRYVIRYSHWKGQLVVKVTDNVQVLQYKTDQQSDVKKLDELHMFFVSLMAGLDPEELVESAVEKSADKAAASQKRKGRRGAPSKA